MKLIQLNKLDFRILAPQQIQLEAIYWSEEVETEEGGKDTGTGCRAFLFITFDVLQHFLMEANSYYYISHVTEYDESGDCSPRFVWVPLVCFGPLVAGHSAMRGATVVIWQYDIIVIRI